MKWYYAVGTEQQGPVDKEELIRLADKGTIQPSTKVWSEGMNDWEPFSKNFPTTSLHYQVSRHPLL